MSSIIIIPVYKPKLNAEEEKSIRQTLTILGKHEICFVAPVGAAFSYFEDFGIRIEFFHPDFFDSIAGYNRLLLSFEFFKRFARYSHMLICQTDVWVFRDELEHWMHLPYDYIGSPIRGKDGNWIPNGGNGGFSVRNISSAMRVLKTRKIISNPSQVLREHRKFHNWSGLFLRSPIILARMFGYRNNSLTFVKEFGSNEDVFWSLYAPLIDSRFRVAPYAEEIAFGFDRHPEVLFAMNHNKLPFGCHAWEKTYATFWKTYLD
jgi:hypothetical protein